MPRIERTPLMNQMFDPTIRPSLNVLMTKRAPIGQSWRLRCHALLHPCMSVEFTRWDGLLALGASFEVFMIDALS